MANTRTGELRLTIPLRGLLLDEAGYQAGEGRIPLTPDVFLVVLDSAEVQRLYEYNYETIGYRLEIFNALPDSWDPRKYWDEGWHGSGGRNLTAAAEAMKKATAVLDCQALVCRRPLSPFSFLVDRFDGTIWRRETHLRDSYVGEGAPGGRFPEARLVTWGALVGPVTSLSKGRVRLALDLYGQSIAASARRDPDVAFLQGAIALEVLLGGDRNELTHRIATRGAFLVAKAPSDRQAVHAELKRLYTARSGLVHSGKSPSPADYVLLQQFLMAAIPRAVATGLSGQDLVAALDAAVFGEQSPQLSTLWTSAAWWSYCDFRSLL